MKWFIEPNTILKGHKVDLIPLTKHHFNELLSLTNDQRNWELIPVDMNTNEKVLNRFNEALIEKEKGSQFPFVIFNKNDNKIIGSTRLMDIQPQHRKLEIGWTWMHPDYWGTANNTECKYLLLKFCFENLGAIRVYLKTDEINIRSQKAIEKIGGKFEGLFRSDYIRENGTMRNTCYYSILNSEWRDSSGKLIQILNQSKVPLTENCVVEFDGFYLRLLQLGDAAKLFHYIQRNKNRIENYAPQSVKSIVDIDSAKSKILNRLQLLRNKTAFIYSLFDENYQLVADIRLMNIDWTIPEGEMGYHIDANFEGNGITTRLVNQFCEYAFTQLGFNKVFLRIKENNIGSRRIAEKNNFYQIGLLRKDYKNFENELVDVIYYEKLKTNI